MRAASWTMWVVLLAGSVVLAQGTPKSEPLPEKKSAANPNDDKLKAILKDREEKLKSIDRFMVNCNRVELDSLTGKTVEYVGEIRHLKPNYELLDLGISTAGGAGPRSNRELIVSDGKKLYEYKFAEKLIRIHDLPKAYPLKTASYLDFFSRISEDARLQKNLLFGQKIDEFRDRYDLVLKKAVDGEGYIYIMIRPKSTAKEGWIKEAELVLYSRQIANIEPANPLRAAWAMLPARLWFRAPNGNESTWTFENYDLEAKLAPESFAPPMGTQGWRTETIRSRTDTPAPEPKIKDDPKLKAEQPPKSKLSTDK